MDGDMAKSSMWGKHHLILLMIGISGVTPKCIEVDTILPIDDVACQPFESRNITTMKLEFCSLACVQSQGCEATIYDKSSGGCMLMNDPCFSLKPQFNHVYRSFKHECTKWLPPDERYPAYCFTEGGTVQSCVSRAAHQSNVVIGKKTNSFYAINPVSNRVFRSDSYEVLIVEPGPRLNIKTVSSTCGDYHVKDKTAVRTSYL